MAAGGGGAGSFIILKKRDELESAREQAEVPVSALPASDQARVSSESTTGLVVFSAAIAMVLVWCVAIQIMVRTRRES